MRNTKVGASTLAFKAFDEDEEVVSAAKSLLISAVPSRFKMPLRYWYRMAARRLDPELAIISKFIQRGETCADIGANNGLYAYALARQGAFVHAYEPQPSCANVIRAFRSPRIAVHEYALSDHSGSEVLYVPIKSGQPDSGEAALERPSGEFTSVEVHLQRLDDQVLPRLSFIKIDVEGHELKVINGALRTLDHDRPMIVCEIEQRHLALPMTTVFEVLLQRGYRGFFLWQGSIVPVDQFSPTRHQELARRLLSPNEYVNNFIFVHGADPRCASLERMRQ